MDFTPTHSCSLQHWLWDWTNHSIHNSSFPWISLKIIIINQHSSGFKVITLLFVLWLPRVATPVICCWWFIHLFQISIHFHSTPPQPSLLLVSAFILIIIPGSHCSIPTFNCCVHSSFGGHLVQFKFNQSIIINQALPTAAWTERTFGSCWHQAKSKFWTRFFLVLLLWSFNALL